VNGAATEAAASEAVDLTPVAVEHDVPEVVPVAVVDVVAPEPVNGAAPAGAHTVVDPYMESIPASADPEFWPEPEPEPTRKRWYRRIPLSAVLEVLAVILILVFILLRLS
jgi:hypothetical protein